MKKALLATVLVFTALVTGCQSVGVAQTAAKIATNNFCELTPEARAVVRANIDPAVAPNQIRITCADTTEAGDVQD